MSRGRGVLVLHILFLLADKNGPTNCMRNPWRSQPEARVPCSVVELQTVSMDADNEIVVNKGVHRTIRSQPIGARSLFGPGV